MRRNVFPGFQSLLLEHDLVLKKYIAFFAIGQANSNGLSIKN